MFEKKNFQKIQGKSHLRLFIVTNNKRNLPRKHASNIPGRQDDRE